MSRFAPTPPARTPRPDPPGAADSSMGRLRPRFPRHTFLLFLCAAVLLLVIRAGIDLAAGYPLPGTTWRLPAGWGSSTVSLARNLRTHTAGAIPVAKGLLAVAVGLTLVWAIRRRHARADLRIRSSVAKELRVPVDAVGLDRAAWRSGRLVRARLAYPRGRVTADLSVELSRALEPFTAVPVRVIWQQARDRFVVAPRPAVVKRLEEQYSGIKAVFEALSHIIPTLVIDQKRTQVDAAGVPVRVVATYGLTARDIGDGFRQRVQTVLDAKAPSPTGYWTLVWDPAANQVSVSPALPLPARADYPLVGPMDRMTIPVGVGDGGQQTYWCPEMQPHMMVVGPTGTGKTIFINSVIEGAAARGWQLLLCDPKELSFSGYEPLSLTANRLPTWPGVDVVATTEAQMEGVIEHAYQEMRGRYEALKSFSIREEELRPVLFIIDEAGELVERLTEYHTGDEKYADLRGDAESAGIDPDSVAKPKGTKNPQLRKVWSILRLGRQCRVFVLLATQRPDVSFIPGEARSNLIARVGLGRLDGAALDMVFGTRTIQQRVYEVSTDPATGARRRTRVRGRATVDLGSGPQTIQGYWVPDPAKAISRSGRPPELDAGDLELVRKLQEFVQRHHAHWATAKVDRPAGLRTPPRDEPTPSDEAAPEVLTAAALERPGVETQNLPWLAADRLREGSQAVLEVDGENTLVQITEIIDDPDAEPGRDELQLTYEIIDGPNIGQLGVTTVGADEQIPIPES